MTKPTTIDEVDMIVRFRRAWLVEVTVPSASKLSPIETFVVGVAASRDEAIRRASAVAEMLRREGAEVVRGLNPTSARAGCDDDSGSA